MTTPIESTGQSETTGQFWTIGHSTRSVDELIAMLLAARVNMLVDVRSFPRSRTNPAFNIDTLPNDLAMAQISYQHWPELGGRRSKQKTVNPATNAWWRVQSFHNYADYALGPEFGDALTRLIALGEQWRPALMCAEAVWWRCHRRIITDYLLLSGHSVIHLMAPGHSENAKPTPGAHLAPDGHVIYPAAKTPPEAKNSMTL